MAKTYVIVSGSSYSGQCSIQAIREIEAKARIISTTSGERETKGADHTVPGIDLDDAAAPEKLRDGVKAVAGDAAVEALIYIPARGEVGLPARLATREQVEAAADYCVRPMLRMMDLLDPQLTLWFSGFITMQPLLVVYGAMSFIKIATERLTIARKDKLKAVRFGMFPSNSVRGIALLVQRNAMRGKYPEMVRMYEEWKASDQKSFLDYFYQKNYRFEEDSYRHVADSPFRPTEPADIVNGVKFALAGTSAPIVNVLGGWLWTDEDMPELPSVFEERGELLDITLE